MQESSTTTLTLNGPSLKPDRLSSDTNLTEIESGQNVTFTCEGYVGKPPGKFVWKKYSRDMNSFSVFSNINTTTTENSTICSYFGRSSLTLQILDEDNQVIIACVEERHLTTSDMEIRTQQLNIYYPVKEVKVFKNPDMPEYTAGPNNHISLTCSAQGKPMPKFIWYKDGDMKNNISTLENLTIRELSVNDTGSYICVAYNMFKTDIFNISANINITVAIIGSVVGAIIFILVTTTLSVMFCRKLSCVAKLNTTNNYDGLDVSQAYVNTEHTKYDTIHHQSTKNHTSAAEMHQYCNVAKSLRKDDPTYDNEQIHVANNPVIARDSTNESSYEIVGNVTDRKDK